MEFRPYAFKHGYFRPILINVEFSPYLCKLWNCLLIFAYIGILALSSQHWNCDRILLKIEILVSLLYWNSVPIFIHICFLMLSFKTMKFWPRLYKHWNYYFILPNMRILILSFQTVEFYPCFYKHWNSDLILPTFAILALWPYFNKHWNCYLILPVIGILIVSYQTL